jgi:hypothetical protein
VNVISVSNGAAHVSLDKAQRACDVSKVVGMTDLEADIHACKFRMINGVRGGWRSPIL